MDRPGFLLSLFFLLTLFLHAQATHFAFGTISWYLINNPSTAPVLPNALGNSTSPRTYQMIFTLGFRRSFPWGVTNIQAGSVVGPGSVRFYPMGSYTGSQLESQNIRLVVQTVFLNDDWFIGQYNTTFSTGRYNSQYFSSNWRSFYTDCCRLSSIRERNNDISWTVTGIMNANSVVSPTATGLPRVYVQLFETLSYTVPWVSPSGNRVIISLATAVDSTLTRIAPVVPSATVPVGPYPPSASNVFTLDRNTGTCTWRPAVTGLYAVAFFVEEDCQSRGWGVACANNSIGATPSGGTGASPANCCTRVPLDFIFQVVPSCSGQANCVEPPYFISPFLSKSTPSNPVNTSNWVWYFYRGLEGSFKVCALTDTKNQTTYIDFSTRPQSSSLTLDAPEVQDIPTCYTFKWAPGLADIDQYLCAVATALPGYQGTGVKSLGSYCILLKIIDAPVVVASGIVRDFHWYHHDFNRSYGDCFWCTPSVNNWVLPTLDSNRKPVLNTAFTGLVTTRNSGLTYTANTNEGFYDWYFTDPATTNPRNVQVVVPIILNSGGSINNAIFRFLSSAFFPIDNQGFGNEGMDHNYFYTYEMNMYITYLNSSANNGTSQVMDVAADDDLWIFIDNKLPPGWNLHGIKTADNSSGTPLPRRFVISLDNLNLTSGETYKCDIFYANRFRTPYFDISVPPNSLCSQLTSGLYALQYANFNGQSLINGYTTTNIPANSLVYYAPSTGAVPSLTSYTRNGTSVYVIKLFDKNSQGATSLCYSTPLKALHGFVATFSFVVPNPSYLNVDGFAFVLNSYVTSVRGGEAGNLGYGGLPKTFAIEFDMLGNSVQNDPDFRTCCGAFPPWKSAGANGNLPYGQVSYHSNLIPTASGYLANSADEASSALIKSGSSSGKIFLDFKNGTEYNVRVLYQPATDDGTANPQPGWIWVYINTQIEPIVAAQVDGVQMRNMLGGSTSMCFTTSGQNPAPSLYGADILLLDWSVLIVPTDPKSTRITSAQIVGQPAIAATSPISQVIAGQTAQVTVQARDACDNPITVGGEGSSFNCSVSKANCQIPPVACTWTDNDDGSYTFSYTPTIADSTYQLDIKFEGIPIKSSPYAFSVIAAAADVTTSRAVFGELPELYSNAGNPFAGSISTPGMWAARFSQFGRVVQTGFFLSTDSAGFIAFLNGAAATEYVLLAITGSVSAAFVSASAATVTAVTGATRFSSITSTSAYALIARKSFPPTCTPSCELLNSTSIVSISARGVDNSSISFTRMFTLMATSANQACGPYARLNSVYDDIRVPAGQWNQFTIQARDIYSNLNKGTQVSTSFLPDLTPPINNDLSPATNFPQTGYFYWQFYSTKAGNYFLYTGLDGSSNNINNGVGSPPYGPYSVTIVPGPANRTTSFCQGASLTQATAGQWATIQLVLNDQWVNPINFMNPSDVVSAVLVSSLPANNTPVYTLNTSWQDAAGCGTKCVLMASFNYTVASIPGVREFQILLTVNGVTQPCGTAGNLPDIVPGPLSPALTTFSLGPIGDAIAGTSTSFLIQARDQFGNPRRTPNAPGDTFQVAFSPAVSGYSAQYSGNGQYLVSFTPIKKGNLTISVSVVSTGAGDVKPAGTYAVGTPQQIRVLPGPADAASGYDGLYSGIVVVAGTLNSFTIISRDRFNNSRDNTPYGIAVATANDYFFRFWNPTRQVDGFVAVTNPTTLGITGNFTISYNGTIAGDYQVDMKTVLTQQDIGIYEPIPSPFKFVKVVPACTFPNNTLFSGPGLTGGKGGDVTNFTLTARDYWTNIQADWRDSSNYNASVVDGGSVTAATISQNNQGTGMFTVQYTVPTPTGNSLNYSIVVCHNGLNGSSSTFCFPSWCRSFPAVALPANSSSYATIAVNNGTAGVLMSWVINDTTIDGSRTNPPVSFFTISVARISDGAQASVPPAPYDLSPISNPSWSLTNVTFTPTANIGDFRVRVYAFGAIETEQSKNGLNISIGPGVVFPPNCQFTGLPAIVNAGSIGKFQVLLRDRWNHDIGDGKTVQANVTLGGTTVGLTGTFNGTSQMYDFSYNLTVANVWTVTIWEAQSLIDFGIPITTLPTITVNPGPADCTTSYVEFPLGSVPSPFTTAGVSTSFRIIPNDRWGNRVTDRSTMFTITDNGNATFSQVVKTDTGNTIVVDVIYTPYKVMTPANLITIQVGGCALSGTGSNSFPSPLNVTVDPAAIYPPLSGYSGITGSVVAGSPLTLTLTLKDQYDNNWFSNKGQLLAAFVNVPGSSTSGARSVGVNPQALGNGAYSFTLSGIETTMASSFNVSGNAYLNDYSWSVLALGTPITGTDALTTIVVPPVSVTAGPTSPPMTLPPSLYPAQSDILRTYQVTLRDQYGNQRYLTTVPETVAFNWIPGTIDCTPGEVIPPATSTGITTESVVHNGLGVYNVTILPSIIGRYTLNLTVTTQGGVTGWYGSPQCQPTQKLVQDVTPGPASPPHSWWTISNKNFTAGDKARLFLQVNDKRGNNIMRSGTSLAFGRVGLDGVAFDSTTVDTWTYNISWTPLSGNLVWVTPDFSSTTAPTLPIAPGSTPPTFGEEVDYQNSSYAFTVTLFKAGIGLPVVISMQNASGDWVTVPWPVNLESDGSINVNPGPPRQFSPSPAQLVVGQLNDTTAAIPTSFTLTSYDAYGNQLTSNAATYTVVMQSQINGYTIPTTATPGPMPGQTTFSFLSYWDGPFTVAIVMHPNDGSPDVVPQTATLTIDHATCAYLDPSKPYRCPDRTCVSMYSQCSSLGADACFSQPQNKTTCADGSCVADAADCLCPLGQDKCADGHCVVGTCPPPPTGCPSGTIQCADSSCRASTTDCPSSSACAPGYVACPSGVSCARNASDCTAITSACTTGYRCATGSCVSQLSDCPTPTTCPPATPTYCLSDGSCQVDAASCPDQYPCFAPNTYRCPGTGLCVSSSSQCPTLVTCPSTWVRCQDNTCARTATDCPIPYPCGYNQTLCPDGSCENNLLFCPALVSCPATTPVLCWDKTCVQYSAQCSVPQSCPTGQVTCPGGSCANSFSLCPTGTTCAPGFPVLCADGSCQNSSTYCQSISSCPVSQPVRCPDGQSCRGSLADCPTIISCPSGRVKCPDGTCALALDQCGPVTNCPTGLLRCPGGECVSGSTDLCPTHVTCPATMAKCLDGTCRTVCPTTYQTCPAGLVTCPQAAAGVQCATDITLCPQQPTCPSQYPVRCSDALCQATVDNCPPPPTSYPINKIPCADGTWATDITSCPTPITCPPSTPAKCTDNTCRVSSNDCPVPQLCPSTQPYLCSTGACVTVPWDPSCTVTSVPCSGATPIQCPPYGSINCQANATMCSAPLNSTTGGSICGPTQTYCRTGSCVNSPDDCPAVACSSAFPYQCPDGLCASDVSKCNNAETGCPWDKPQRCPYTGACVADKTDTSVCIKTNGAPTTCPDGSIQQTGVTCPLENGCPVNLPARCFDGTCVTDFSVCTSSAPVPSGGSYPAVCAPETPYKCPDGFCAKSSTACPPQLVGSACDSTAPFLCANGQCVSSSLLCPPLNPTCPNTTVRCDDSTCKAPGTCSLLNTCPTGTSRCSNGLCTSDPSLCTLDSFTGCPTGYTKCASGQCSNTVCGNSSAPNGCPAATPVKCYDGSCAVSSSSCNLPNGCPSTLPSRCPNGDCVASPTNCPAGNTCPNGGVRCADQSCAPSVPACTTINGCNTTAPFRCADGTCKVSSSDCAPTLVCASGVPCSGGSCAASLNLCPPMLCVAPLQYCNFACNPASVCNSTVAVCPVSSPIRCSNNGACVSTLAACGGTQGTGGPSNQNCNPSQVKCFDGSCANSYTPCIAIAQQAAGEPASNPTSAQGATGCPSGQIMCPNGVCVPSGSDYACTIIPACPLGQYRYWNGSCLNSTAGLPGEPACSSGLRRCEDGWCRAKKLGYDGCGLERPYHCNNRECATTPSGCAQAALGNPLNAPPYISPSRRLLQASIPPCLPTSTKSCVAQTKAALVDVTVDITQSVTDLSIAINQNLVSIASLTIPSGAFETKNGAKITSISIRPVPESRIRWAVNEIVPSRRQAYGSFFPFSNTVLSPAFECVIPDEVKQPFKVNVTYKAWIDQVAYIKQAETKYADVCLARLVELQGFSTWECLIDSITDRSNSSGSYYVYKVGDPEQVVRATFDRCAPISAPGVVSPYNGTVYAFVWSPVPSNPEAPDGLDVVQRNVVWIILGILLGIAMLVLLAYCAFRLFRYREKYHNEREEADRLQEEVENMRQFGGESGNKDDQVAMTQNPLAVQLKDVQARYNEEELKLQQAEASLRKQEGEIRQQHIENMRENRNKLAEELEKLKSQLQEAQASAQPKATFEADTSPTYTADEPVREEFDTQTTVGAQPRRKGKDL